MKTMHFCFNCGEELGMFEGKQRQRDFDTCGKRECYSAARDSESEMREQAHEELDRMNGWGRL